MTYSLDSFESAYVECMLWSSIDLCGDNEEPENLDDKGFTIWDLAPETLELVKNDCKAFQELASKELERAYAGINGIHYDEEQAGHDFWLTRNGHGAGFWDRGLATVGDILSSYAKTFGHQDPYSYEGKIYI